MFDYTLLLNDPIFRAVVIFVGFFFAAIFVNLVLYQLIRVFTRKTKSELDDHIRRALRKPVSLTIIIAGLYVSLKGLWPDSELLKSVIATLLNLIWTFFILRIIGVFIEHYKHRPRKGKFGGLNKQMLPFFEKISKVFAVLICIFWLMRIWKIDISPLMASAGIFGLAIAFAAKDSIANIFGGVFIFFDRTYELGSYVVVADKYRGEVIDVGLRSTKIKTRDDIEVTIPNSIMANSTVVNESGGYKGMLRVRMSLGICYGENVKKVEKILMNVAKKAEWVEREPKPRLRFRKMGKSALQFEFLFWVKDPELRGRALSEMNGLVYERFLKERIKFGYVAEHLVKMKKR